MDEREDHHMPQTVFETRWRQLMDRLGAEPAAAGGVMAELVAAYGDPGRHYHTLGHITELLGRLDRHSQDIADRDAMELAIFFHDAVYDPLRADNEAASAALARERLSALGLDARRVARVEDLVLATRHHEPAGGAGDTDLDQFVDFDLAILASPRETYGAYARAIRAEYAAVPDERYQAGRRRVLEGFLARHIYRSAHLRALWEADARANLAWEIGTLA
jgi:predicted metal-dependent HD superfamily phosphohydrolase